MSTYLYPFRMLDDGGVDDDQTTLLPLRGFEGRTVVKAIKASGGDYTSIQDWNDDLDDTGIYRAGDIASGELYDEAYDETVVLDGGATVGLAQIVLRPASGEEHDGTAGSGARITPSSGSGILFSITTTVAVEIDTVEIDGGDNPFTQGVSLDNAATARFKRMLVHDLDGVSGTVTAFYLSGVAELYNSIVYNIDQTGTGGGAEAYGIHLASSGKKKTLYNVTVYNTRSQGGSASAGFRFDTEGADWEIYNCVAIGSTQYAGTGSIVDWASPSESFATADFDNNASGDTTAPGTTTVHSISAGDQFTDLGAGTEDLHLKSGADLIGAGADLGAGPWSIDIDGRDRDAEGDTWDIGADQYVAVGGTPQTITPAALTSTAAIGDPTASPGAVAASPDALTSGAVLGDPTLGSTISAEPDALTSGAAYGDPTLTPGSVAAQPDAIPSGAAFGEPSAGIGTQPINPDALASGAAFGDPTASPGEVSAQPDALTSGASFGTPVLNPGAVSISVDALVSGAAFGAPTLSATYTIQPDAIVTTVDFGEPALVGGTATLSPAAIVSTVAFGVPTIEGGAQPTLVVGGPVSILTWPEPTSSLTWREPVSPLTWTEPDSQV